MPATLFESAPSQNQAKEVDTSCDHLVLALGDSGLQASGLVLPPETDIWKPELNRGQHSILIFASLGATTVEAAQQLGWSEDSVKATASEIKDSWNVKNMAEATNYGILNRYIPLKRDSRHTNVTPLTGALLRYYAQGRHNGDFIRAVGKGDEAKLAKWSQTVFSRIKASGKTHSVLRSYQAGIFRLP